MTFVTERVLFEGTLLTQESELLDDYRFTWNLPSGDGSFVMRWVVWKSFFLDTKAALASDNIFTGDKNRFGNILALRDIANNTDIEFAALAPPDITSPTAITAKSAIIDITFVNPGIETGIVSIKGDLVANVASEIYKNTSYTIGYTAAAATDLRIYELDSEILIHDVTAKLTNVKIKLRFI